MGNNMKSFLFTVLLFCSLHVHKSSAIPAFRSPFFKSKPTFSAPTFKPNTPRVPPSNPNTPRPPPSDNPGLDLPSQQSPPPVEITGLSVVKQYLYDFGYMTNATSPFSDILDSETTTAITTFQNKFNLHVTGKIDNSTLNLMLLPRCVVPDINIVYNLNSETRVSWPQGIRWFPNGTSTNHLTYGFLPESKVALDFQSVFADSFNRWSKAIAELNLTKINFTVTDYNTSDIKIGFYFLDNTVEDVVAGTIIRYEDDSSNGNGSKIVGDIRLDASKYWVLPGYNGTWSYLDGNFDLGTVAMHQIGHILGLSHSSNADSIMYPFISTTNEVKVNVTADDKNNIMNVYKKVSTSTSTTSPTISPFWSCVLILTNFTLGFILLLY